MDKALKVGHEQQVPGDADVAGAPQRLDAPVEIDTLNIFK